MATGGGLVVYTKWVGSGAWPAGMPSCSKVALQLEAFLSMPGVLPMDGLSRHSVASRNWIAVSVSTGAIWMVDAE